MVTDSSWRILLRHFREKAAYRGRKCIHPACGRDHNHCRVGLSITTGETYSHAAVGSAGLCCFAYKPSMNVRVSPASSSTTRAAASVSSLPEGFPATNQTSRSPLSTVRTPFAPGRAAPMRWRSSVSRRSSRTSSKTQTVTCQPPIASILAVSTPRISGSKGCRGGCRDAAHRLPAHGVLPG